jgi:hypothetical protein
MQRFVLSPGEAGRRELVRGVQRARDLGPALLVVDGAGWGKLPARAAEALAVANCVTVAVVRGAAPAGAVLEPFDLRARVGEGDAHEWNVVGSAAAVDAWLERVARRLEQVGLPGVIAARLIGHTHGQTIPQALFAEATSYSMLQAGPEHERWLGARA